MKSHLGLASTLLVFFLSLQTPQAQAQGLVQSQKPQVTVRGASSCGLWVKNRETNSLERSSDLAWVLGFLSGISMGSTVNVFKDIRDSESLVLWMDNYCKANPLKDVAAGSVALVLELQKTKR